MSRGITNEDQAISEIDEMIASIDMALGWQSDEAKKLNLTLQKVKTYIKRRLRQRKDWSEHHNNNTDKRCHANKCTGPYGDSIESFGVWAYMWDDGLWHSRAQPANEKRIRIVA